MRRRVRPLSILGAVSWVGAVLGASVLGAGGCVATETEVPEERSCEDLLVPQPCFDCLEGACCEQLRACFEDTAEGGCTSCLAGDAEACTSSQVALALYGCLLAEGCNAACGEEAPGPACGATAQAASEGSCAPEGEGVACNPITNASCDGAEGEACDYDAGRFRCFPGPNDRGLCEPCGGDAGFCGAGLSCYSNVKIGAEGLVIEPSCARSCCDDADCGGGVCTGAVEAGGARVGVCLEPGGE